MMKNLHETNFKTIYYSSSTMQLFYTALKDFMSEFGCIYLSYVFEDTTQKKRIGFTSNPDWQSEYIGNKLIEECHLWKTVIQYFINTNRENFILPWAINKPNTGKEKDILLYREEFHIGQGISFCTQRNGFREYLALNPEIKEKSFVSNVMINLNLVKTHIDTFRYATQKEFLN